MLTLRGIYPPIPTPFRTSGELALDELGRNLAWWSTTGLAGFVVLGSNGEYVALSEREKLELIRAARDAVPAAQAVIAGTGMEGTGETIRLSRAAAELGADAVIVVTPHYYRSRMDAQALLAHYRAVADAVPVPLLLYNVPANTGLDMPAEVVLRLAEHPNIAGIKDSSGNIANMTEVLRGKPERFAVLAGSASFLLPALALGAAGGVVALANVAPRETVALDAAFARGDLAEARRLQLRLLPVNQAITARWGVPALKVALDLLGRYGGPPRLPLLPLGAAERERLAAILREADLRPVGA
jgi:4-hydroxy-2-oxoglutarate aldolase